MAAFFLSFVSVFVVSLGGRDQMLVARLAERLGKSASLLAVATAASTISAFAMAAAGLALALILPDVAADMLVGFALLLAAIELGWRRPARLPEEPTRSLFASLVVLLAHQLGDASRFCVFAFAAGGSAWMAGIGGALAGATALGCGALFGEEIERFPLRSIRSALSIALLLAAIFVALAARGIIG